MVEIIANRLSHRNSGHYSYDAKQHADEILRAIEDAGMLPPHIRVKNNRISEDNFGQYVSENEWSEE